jgi:hypothetical protein
MKLIHPGLQSIPPFVANDNPLRRTLCAFFCFFVNN